MRTLKNQNGISLFEVLATITIIAIITPIIFGVVTSGQTEYNNQFGNNQQLSKITFTMNAITRGIRCNPDLVESNSPDYIQVVQCDTSVEKYQFDDSDINNKKLILNNSSTLLENINLFEIALDTTNESIKVTILYLDDRGSNKKDRGSNKKYETTIIIR
ncbi:hypothetical protein SAMN05880501_101722 [Ureibacillus xyleni]|uniref:Prepilin-type N-terminal cleavage/methylation domain-containing protein n=1 Tax=Ureibacillus xyleni TaxID=614648 RepID=A0A285RJ75_9BACL|nr:hypothetical protein [Ureibacillus xyleni]SOB93924.1 hypothetical protein SAMN05880501_101722 [Ureibacillus xyleni]